MRVVEVVGVAGRLLVTTSSHVALVLVSVSIALLSYFTRGSDAVNLVPLLAAIAGLTVIEYGKYSYRQLFYLMLISGAMPRHYSMLKVASALIVAVPLSLSTAASGRVAIALLTLFLSGVLSMVLLTYYARKVKESGSVTLV